MCGDCLVTDVVRPITAITSTVGGGATVSHVFTNSYDSMEISGEDDQTNSAGARPTGRDLQQEQAGEQEWSAHAPTPGDLTDMQEWFVQPSPPMPMQLMNTA